MSPEQINDKKYNEKSDIWSAGCVIYEVASLRPPFQATNHLALACKIKEGKFDRIPFRYSEHLQSVLSKMLSLNPNERPSISSLLRCKYIDIRRQEMTLRLKVNQYNSKCKELSKSEE